MLQAQKRADRQTDVVTPRSRRPHLRPFHPQNCLSPR